MKIILGILTTLGVFSFANQSEQVGSVEVRDLVLGAQTAAWVQHDFERYASMWAEDARMVSCRQEAPGPFETTCNLNQILNTRKLFMTGPVASGECVTFENVRVSVSGNEAELRLRQYMHHGEDFEANDELYRLRLTSAGWKVYLNRCWPFQNRVGGRVVSYDAQGWAKLDQEAETAMATDSFGETAARALFNAQRFAQADIFAARALAGSQAAPEALRVHGDIQIALGNVPAALFSYHAALGADPNQPVPDFAR